MRFHKWIALAVGVQILGWVLGGLIMTVLPIEQVRGQHRLSFEPPAALNLSGVLPAQEMARRADLGDLAAATLKSTPRGPIWVLTTVSGAEAWYDAGTGENVEEITAEEARAAAVAAYRGPGRPARVVEHYEAPIEAGTSGALFQVEFDDPERTSFYVSAYTGELMSQRSNLWRFYNFFYQVHLMDFSGAQNYNHPAIVIVTALTLVVVLTGFVLLWIRVGRDLKGWGAGRRKRPAP